VRDFYKVLGIASTADDRRIKTAFRRRAKAYHPDLNPGDSRAEERFKELTEAYEVLRSAHGRATYDAYRAQRRSAVRRRVAGSAALMAASFVLTLGSAFAALAVYNGGAPVRDGWQLPQFVERAVAVVATAFGYPANEWTKGTSVALAKASQTEITKTSVMAVPPPAEPASSEQHALSKTASAERGKADAANQAKAHKRVAASRTPRMPPSDAESREKALQSMVAIGDESRTWPETDAPRMSLGRNNR
jgi:curved DNA-binding protein CbpA